ncbi:virulence factor TspB C-terminal domain-related protein [Xanthomonas arboricola]|uniref:virulence factor TspB C-terminal domain-related protein n=1 Tax=Xanthomonas arboricola TaxID=56448 RepID=UPI003A8C1322
MAWLARVFATAMVRRVAYVLVALLFATCGVARAASFGVQTCNVNTGCDQGAAYGACMAQVGDHKAKFPTATYYEAACRHAGGQNPFYTPVVDYREPGGGRTTRIGADEYYGAKCESRTDYNGPFPSVYGTPRNGSVQCFSGCQLAYYDNGDGTFNGKYTSVPGVCGPDDLDDTPDCQSKFGSGYYFNAALGVCEPKPPEKCPEGQAKDAKGNCQPDACPEGMTLGADGTCKPSEKECPAGNIKSPAGKCLPGDGQCASGEALGKDGTCKRDANGDGKPDEEEGEDDPNKDSASGGDSCDVAPSCSGNVIQCLQVKVQWRIDCNTRRNVNISGGACAAMPVCTGDGCKAMEYAQLIQQWKSACALEKLAKGDKPTPGTDATDKNGNGVPDALEGRLQTDGPGDGKEDVDGSKRFGLRVSTDRLDRDNIFGGGTCPQPPTFTIKGTTISGADFPYFCQFAAILRALILMFGAYLAIKILMGWGF